MLKDFREFISKGNVIDLAIGIIIGAAFTAIVSSFVKDILTPIIGLAGKSNFENLFLVIKPGDNGADSFTTIAAAQQAHAVTLNYGNFLNALINFILVAIVLFAMVKMVNKTRRTKPAEAPAPPEPTKEELLLTEIRDLLKSKPAK